MNSERSLFLPWQRYRCNTQCSMRAGLTGTTCGTLLLAVGWVESKVKLLPEQSPVVCVDQLKYTLMDDVRLKTGTKKMSGNSTQTKN